MNFKTYPKSRKLKNDSENRRIFRTPSPLLLLLSRNKLLREYRSCEKTISVQAKQESRDDFPSALLCRLWGRLYFCTTTSLSPKKDRYVCSNYKSNIGTCSANFYLGRKAETVCLAAVFGCDGAVFDDATAFMKPNRNSVFKKPKKSLRSPSEKTHY